MRSWKPALARDYDVFFAAIGLLCGGILFFQGWRLDPILQFGQFLLAGTTVFFGYESVRLRGIAADQARRSSYFDEDPVPASMPGRRQSEKWEESFESYDKFDEPNPGRRRFQNPDEPEVESGYRSRRTTRAAIPEEAASRSRRIRSDQNNWNENTDRDRDRDRDRRMARFKGDGSRENSESFGERRNLRQDQRRGTRPTANEQRNRGDSFNRKPVSSPQKEASSSPGRRRGPQGSPIRQEAQDASYTQGSSRPVTPQKKDARKTDRTSSSSRYSQRGPQKTTPRSPRPRDNNSRFDD